MGKRFGGALAILLLVFGIGALVAPTLFSSDDGDAPQPIAAQARDASSDAAPAKELAVVTAITGTLETRSADGTWTPVNVGDVVSSKDALRTGSTSAPATIRIGEHGTTISLAGEFTVPTLTTELSTVRVVDGRVDANVAQYSDARLRVEARGSDAVAETEEGEFSVLSTGQGQVAVASKRGRVRVRAGGESVDVEAGKQTLVESGGPPSPPTTIAPSLLLKVGKTARTLRVQETVVRGKTSPGAIVSIGGVRVQADATGAFSTKVALREGKNALSLRVEDSLGRQLARDLPAVHVDSKGPKTKAGVEW